MNDTLFLSTLRNEIIIKRNFDTVVNTICFVFLFKHNLLKKGLLKTSLSHKSYTNLSFCVSAFYT